MSKGVVVRRSARLRGMEGNAASPLTRNKKKFGKPKNQVGCKKYPPCSSDDDALSSVPSDYSLFSEIVIRRKKKKKVSNGNKFNGVPNGFLKKREQIQKEMAENAAKVVTNVKNKVPGSSKSGGDGDTKEKMLERSGTRMDGDKGVVKSNGETRGPVTVTTPVPKPTPSSSTAPAVNNLQDTMAQKNCQTLAQNVPVPVAVANNAKGSSEPGGTVTLLTPEEITGAYWNKEICQIFYKVKWRNEGFQPTWIDGRVCKERFPQVLFEFFEKQMQPAIPINH